MDSTTKKVVAYGRNRQYIPYFRSDLHAEMNLINRYEDRMKKTRSLEKGTNPRKCENLVLVTSMESCPMCLTRIINSGIKTVLYLTEDKQGGEWSPVLTAFRRSGLNLQRTGNSEKPTARPSFDKLPMICFIFPIEILLKTGKIEADPVPVLNRHGVR